MVLLLCEILIEPSVILKIFKVLSINFYIDLTDQNINIQSDITNTIMLTSKNFSSDSKLVVDIGVRYNLQVSVGIAVE